jgi:drug/metabolite transporter (DMT)-like permease
MSSAVLLALGAVACWSLLALLAVELRAVPPFLLLALALGGAAILAAPTWRRWQVPWSTLALGVYGLFGFHLLLFVALRLAPAVQANLVNYLWPLLIVLLAPVLLPGTQLTGRHVVAGAIGLLGAALVITRGQFALSATHLPGYLLALGSALVWATYSLLTRRVPHFPTAAVGGFCAVSAVLAGLCHVLLEPRHAPTAQEALLIALLAAGPMGTAFFLWDAALKRGDARVIGTLAYLTPLGSTLALLAGGHGAAGWPVLAGGALIVGAAVLGATTPANRADRAHRST